jgi:hypothetical protein
MAGKILRSDVGFGFDNASYGCAFGMLAYQIFAQQLLSNIDGGLLVERAKKFYPEAGKSLSWCVLSRRSNH